MQPETENHIELNIPPRESIAVVHCVREVAVQMQKQLAMTGTDGLGKPDGDGVLYRKVARELERQIRTGTLAVGEKVPSIRAIKRDWQVSTSTALHAYFWLENRGLIEARQRSGFYVRIPASDLAPEPDLGAKRSVPRDAGLDPRLGQLLQLRAASGALQLGSVVPSADFYPVRKLNQIIRRILHEEPNHSCGYDFPPGNSELRRQIARHASRQIGRSSWEEIIVTAGAMDGLALCLRAVAKAGDVIALESPTFFGVLQLIQSLGMKPLEIRTDPRSGMDLGALEHAMQRKRVAACVVIGNCHNPLGYILSEAAKSRLADLSKRYRIPIVEDDVFGDVAFQEPRPRTIKSFDSEGLVLTVSSFSKTLGPGYRVGWVQAGRWQSTVEQLQFINTLGAASLPQKVIARFLQGGGYERHLRRVRMILADRLATASRAIAHYFPPGTRVTRPQGGFLLWVQMPDSVDAITVFEKALQQKIAVVPGPMFTTTGQFKNYLRVSCGIPWSQQVEDSIATLGCIAKRLVTRTQGRHTMAQA